MHVNHQQCNLMQYLILLTDYVIKLIHLNTNVLVHSHHLFMVFCTDNTWTCPHTHKLLKTGQHCAIEVTSLKMIYSFLFIQYLTLYLKAYILNLQSYTIHELQKNKKQRPYEYRYLLYKPPDWQTFDLVTELYVSCQHKLRPS